MRSGRSYGTQSLLISHASRAKLLDAEVSISGKIEIDTHAMLRCSRVGTGCSDAERRDIYERLKPYLVTRKPANVSSTGHPKVHQLLNDQIAPSQMTTVCSGRNMGGPLAEDNRRFVYIIVIFTHSCRSTHNCSHMTTAQWMMDDEYVSECRTSVCVMTVHWQHPSAGPLDVHATLCVNT